MAGCAETRLPVTMRLPRREVELVSEYAQEAGVTRTEAFLHFLRLGLQVDDSSERLASIEQSVEEILRCVTAGKPASGGFAAAKAADGGGLEEGEEIRL